MKATGRGRSASVGGCATNAPPSATSSHSTAWRASRSVQPGVPLRRESGRGRKSRLRLKQSLPGPSGRCRDAGCSQRVPDLHLGHAMTLGGVGGSRRHVVTLGDVAIGGLSAANDLARGAIREHLRDAPALPAEFGPGELLFRFEDQRVLSGARLAAAAPSADAGSLSTCSTRGDALLSPALLRTAARRRSSACRSRSPAARAVSRSDILNWPATWSRSSR